MTSFSETWSQAKALAAKAKADLERISDEIAKLPGWKLKPVGKYGVWKAEHKKEAVTVTAPNGEALLERVRATVAKMEGEAKAKSEREAARKAQGIR